MLQRVGSRYQQCIIDLRMNIGQWALICKIYNMVSLIASRLPIQVIAIREISLNYSHVNGVVKYGAELTLLTSNFNYTITIHLSSTYLPSYTRP